MSGTYSNLPPVMSHTTMRANFLQSLQVFTQFAVQVTGCELLNIRTQHTVYNIMYKLASRSRQHANTPNRNTNGINSLCTSVRRLHLKCDGTRAETRFCLSAKRMSPFKSAGGVSSVDYWLTTPFTSFPFTPPTVRHHVPSYFNWTLTRCIIKM